jgi:hypothetical protein
MAQKVIVGSNPILSASSPVCTAQMGLLHFCRHRLLPGALTALNSGNWKLARWRLLLAFEKIPI